MDGHALEQSPAQDLAGEMVLALPVQEGEARQQGGGSHDAESSPGCVVQSGSDVPEGAAAAACGIADATQKSPLFSPSQGL